jgi:hypothetical protein
MRKVKPIALGWALYADGFMASIVVRDALGTRLLIPISSLAHSMGDKNS